MSEELKPCPFCGSTNLGFLSLFAWEVQCNLCLAEGPKADTREEAIAAWNRRANEGESND